VTSCVGHVTTTSYVQHAVPRREVREKPVWEPSTARLDGMSTARKDYGPKEAVKQPSYKPQAVAFRSTHQLTQDSSTFQAGCWSNSKLGIEPS